ncbi:MAG: LTA synthase family protein [Lachnospiraceae bacterium]|nr:LTA synthase family protein [Lachnospiraceae bacterium]
MKSFRIKNLLFFILMPAVIMYLFEAYTHNPFVRMKPGIQVLNIFLFIVIETMVLFITGSLKTALRIMTVVFMILGLGEYYLVEFRGVTLLPWDLGSLGTAAEFVGVYDYVPDIRAVLCILGFIAAFVICHFADLKIGDVGVFSKGTRTRRILLRLAAVLASVFVIVLYTRFVQTDFACRTFGFYTKLFTPTAISERDGTLTAFLMELQYMNVEKPHGYTDEEAEKVLKSYKPVSPDKKANIIVIMNEAFSDLSVLGEFNTDNDYMPFVHELQSGACDDCLTGTLNVSIVGGNTPNTEFEFLTGNSLYFLPEGSIPYQQYVREGIYSLPAYLSEVGYTTVGMHPYYPEGWERGRVYSELGFERSLFIDDFDRNASVVRGYVSDMACSEQLIKEYEANLVTGKPFFSFLVTMQNHSPYEKDPGTVLTDVNIEGGEGISNIETTERYLSLIKRSDEAFRYLTEYFADTEEPVVIVMFGDHQPSDSVVRPIWELQGKDSRNLDEEDVDKRYMVPYVIWANFDIEGGNGKDTSANFLGNKVLDIAGAGKYPYRCFLDDVSEQYPVFSAVRAVDSNGNVQDDKALDRSTAVTDYRKLQYHELFR